MVCGHIYTTHLSGQSVIVCFYSSQRFYSIYLAIGPTAAFIGMWNGPAISSSSFLVDFVLSVHFSTFIFVVLLFFFFFLSLPFAIVVLFGNGFVEYVIFEWSREWMEWRVVSFYIYVYLPLQVFSFLYFIRSFNLLPQLVGNQWFSCDIQNFISSVLQSSFLSSFIYLFIDLLHFHHL